MFGMQRHTGDGYLLRARQHLRLRGREQPPCKSLQDHLLQQGQYKIEESPF